MEIVCWPTLLVVDPTGCVIAEFQGEIQANFVREFVRVALDYYKNQLKKGKF